MLDRLELSGDETRARRRLRQRPGHPRCWSSACPTGSVIAVDGSASMIEKAREALRRPGDEALRRRPARARARASRSTWSSRARPSTGSSTTTRCSRACARRCGPAGGSSAQCGGAGNIAALTRSDRRGRRRREPFAPTSRASASRGTTPPPEETEERLRARRLRRGRAAGCEPWAGRARRSRRVHRDRLPRPAHGPRCRWSCAIPSSTRCSSVEERAARARLRAPQHRCRRLIAIRASRAA